MVPFKLWFELRWGQRQKRGNSFSSAIIHQLFNVSWFTRPSEHRVITISFGIHTQPPLTRMEGAEGQINSGFTSCALSSSETSNVSTPKPLDCCLALLSMSFGAEIFLNRVGQRSI